VHYPTLLVDVAIFILSLWVGFEVISKVPATLHTPLMSAANSIHGIVLAGAMLIAVTANNAVGYVIAFVAAAFAAMNVVGGYVVTGRMLAMFRKRPAVPAGPARAGAVSTVAAPAIAAANGSGQPVTASKPNTSSQHGQDGQGQGSQERSA
jgi:H+-translocating NAD(P) transhydrogenase subunit alpha